MQSSEKLIVRYYIANNSRYNLKVILWSILKKHSIKNPGKSLSPLTQRIIVTEVWKNNPGGKRSYFLFGLGVWHFWIFKSTVIKDFIRKKIKIWTYKYEAELVNKSQPKNLDSFGIKSNLTLKLRIGSTSWCHS